MQCEFQPVTSGYRITLTYKLFTLPSAGAKSVLHAADVASTAPIVGRLKELLGVAAWHPLVSCLGAVKGVSCDQ